MSLLDALGVAGVGMILAAYAATILGGLKADGALALSANFLGAALILLSLTREFNLSATLMEGSWALVSLVGLVRVGLRRLRGAPPPAS